MIDTPKQPEISVIIPAYNAARYISESIQTVLNQAYKNLEIIVVDDGSTDQTGEIAGRFCPPVRYVRQNNQGNAAARNRGISEARFEWLAFLDADDLWSPEKLQLQWEHVQTQPDRRISLTLARTFYESGDPPIDMPGFPPAELWNRLVYGQPFGCSHSGLLIHQSCFETVGNFDANLKQSVDWDLFIRLAARYELPVLPQILTYHREHQSNITQSSEVRLEMYLACLIKHRRLFCEQRHLCADWQRSYGTRLMNLGRYHLRRGNYRRALPHLFRSICHGRCDQFSEKIKLLMECALTGVGFGFLFKTKDDSRSK